MLVHIESRPPAARKSKLPSNPQRQQARNPTAFAANNTIPQSIAAPKSAFTSNVNNGNQARSSLPAPPISTPQPPAPEVPSKLPLYKAIYPFQSQQEGEVSFQKDDTMEIVEKDENGWWLARINGNEGWVPSNYLEECVAPKLPPAPPARRRAQPPIPQQQQQQQNTQQPMPQRQPEPTTSVNRTSQYGDAVSVMPGVGAPTTNGIPAWRAALNAKNASAHKAANDTTAAPTPASRGPPVPAKPFVPGSRPAPSIPSSAGKPMPNIPARPQQAASSPQAPPRNSSPAALSLADAVSV